MPILFERLLGWYFMRLAECRRILCFYLVVCNHSSLESQALAEISRMQVRLEVNGAYPGGALVTLAENRGKVCHHVSLVSPWDRMSVYHTLGE